MNRKIPFRSRFKVSGRSSLDNEDEEFRSRVFLHLENRKCRLRRQKIRTIWYNKQSSVLPGNNGLPIASSPATFNLLPETKRAEEYPSKSYMSAPNMPETCTVYNNSAADFSSSYQSDPTDLCFDFSLLPSPSTISVIRNQVTSETEYQYQPIVLNEMDLKDLENLNLFQQDDCLESVTAIEDQKSMAVNQFANETGRSASIDDKNDVIKMFLKEDYIGQICDAPLSTCLEKTQVIAEKVQLPMNDFEETWINKSISRWEECYRVVSEQIHQWFQFPHFPKYSSEQIRRLIQSSRDTSQYLARHKNMKRMFVFYSTIGLGSFLIGDRVEAENYFAEATRCQEEMMSSKHLLIGLFLRCVYYLLIGDRKRSVDESNRVLCMLGQLKKQEGQTYYLFDACVLICFLLSQGYDDMSTRKILQIMINNQTPGDEFRTDTVDHSNLSLHEMMKLFILQEVVGLDRNPARLMTNARVILLATVIGHVIHNLNGNFSELLEFFPILSKIESQVVQQIRDQRVQDTVQMMIVGLRAHLFFFFRMEEECMREANHALDIGTFLINRNEETFWLTVAMEIIFRLQVGAFNLLGMQRSVRVIWEVQRKRPFALPHFERYFNFYRNTYG